MDRAGFVGDDGATHHGVLDLAYLRPIPGMVLMAPRDEAELVDMLYTGAAPRRPGACATRAAPAWACVRDGVATMPVGDGRGVDAQAGSGVALVGYGYGAVVAVRGRRDLAAEGLGAAHGGQRPLLQAGRRHLDALARRPRTSSW